MAAAVFSKARLTLIGEKGIFVAFNADKTSANPPHAFGEDMEVPFIN